MRIEPLAELHFLDTYTRVTQQISWFWTHPTYFELDILPAQVEPFPAHHRAGVGSDHSVWSLRCSWKERLPVKPALDRFALAIGWGGIEGNGQRTY